MASEDTLSMPLPGRPEAAASRLETYCPPAVTVAGPPVARGCGSLSHLAAPGRAVTVTTLQ
jgi:hypothetical protein